MKLRAIFTSSFFLKNIFIVSLIILVFISGVSYKHTLALTESAELVTHSYEVQIELEQLVSHLLDAESGQRGFILSQDSSFLKPYFNAKEKTNVSFNKLIVLTADNIQQQNNLDSLYRLITIRFNYLANSLKKASETPTDAKALNESLIQGKSVMDTIRNQINYINKLETAYLKQRQKKYENEISFAPIFTLLLLLFSLMIFIFSYFKINKDLVLVKKSNEKLIITTESFKHAEVIGKFSSWQWDLESNKLIYSDNQYNLLGYEPQSFEATLENFLEFVHPNDRHLITQGGDDAINEKKSSTAFFRIIRKNGELRYFKSIGKLLTDVNGKKTLIGINCDVTEQHLSSIILEERNRELEQSNKELASFNHIASHDLQEPLRKIQIFISRISEKETSLMSEMGKDYMARIQTSVNRMRILIDDLLLFSRTNKTEKVFEQTDLNFLLENVKQELAQAIEEKNAIIESSELPTLNAINFQIQQLFTNLIGNSLKYSKPGVAPIIKIDCEKITSKDYPILETDTDKKYYKISFTDNGLGFEQQYAENIFILFQRLHHITEYPGTGIGLSICKKIVENHSGFITAEGKPGIGSIFTVFLPE